MIPELGSLLARREAYLRHDLATDRASRRRQHALRAFVASLARLADD